MNALTTSRYYCRFWHATRKRQRLIRDRSCVNGSQSIISAVKNILSLYSLLTAALVKFDHGTLQLALTSDAEPEDELALFSIECLHIWYALLNPREREAHGQIDGSSLWTRSEMSRILLPPCRVSAWHVFSPPVLHSSPATLHATEIALR